jgi:hypothetical protein
MKFKAKWGEGRNGEHRQEVNDISAAPDFESFTLGGRGAKVSQAIPSLSEWVNSQAPSS